MSLDILLILLIYKTFSVRAFSRVSDFNSRGKLFFLIQNRYCFYMNHVFLVKIFLSYDVASENVIKPCIQYRCKLHRNDPQCFEVISKITSRLLMTEIRKRKKNILRPYDIQNNAFLHRYY